MLSLPPRCASLSWPVGAAFLACAPVAQGIERLPPEQKAAGSNPAGGTSSVAGHRLFLGLSDTRVRLACDCSSSLASIHQHFRVSSSADAVPWSRLADVDENRPFPPPWVLAGGIVAALALIFVLGVGYGQQWGAPQWGPLAEWIAGAATFGAVVVALREAARGQRSREIDYEISRRRECITALGDLWGAMVGQMIPFRD